MENKKQKSYFIVKEEVGQAGAGNVWFRYRAPGVFPRDPSMVGIYASPMMNRPDNVSDSIEIARSIGKIRGDPTKTFPGSIVGAPYPGSVTVPNRPFGLGLGIPVIPTLGNPCGVSPCGEQRLMGVPGFAAVPIRKGDFTPGVFDIRPVFPYDKFGVTSTQQATIKFTIGTKSYTVKLPYSEINNIIKLLDEHRSDSTTGAIQIEIRVPTYSWFWPARVRSRSISTVAEVFKKLIDVKDVKFQDADGKDLTSKDVVEQIVTEANKKIAEDTTKSEEERRKNQEAVNKLAEVGKTPEPKAEEKTAQQKEIEALKQRIAELEAATKK
jgi:predicted DNA-binding protein (UPF0251 family)